MAIDRYPGPRCFESNEQTIFRGRSKEIQDLLELIRLEQVLVLFSRSGLGKSSLLNAGVGPALPDFGYQPIRVRFQLFDPKSASDSQATDTTPLSLTLNYIVDEYSSAYQLLKSQLPLWKQQLNALPADDEKQLAIQEAALEQLIQEQIESLNDDEELSDVKMAAFKQKQQELIKQPVGQTDQRNALRAKIEAGEAALSLTVEKNGKYSPVNTTDPFGEPIGGRLWETLKLHPFPNGAEPVFFFDQFEEFFAAPAYAKQDFLTQLAEVLCNQPPRRVSSRIARELYPAEVSLRSDLNSARTTELVAWERHPPVKCVFAIRDDRLAEIDSLERYIPLVLKNRYKLNPLNGDNARLAIVEPAAAIGDFTTPPFHYAVKNVPDDNSANTLQLIIDGLSNDRGEVDSTQLQMVCNNIETSVKQEIDKAKKPGKQTDKITFVRPEGNSLRVDKRLIPNAQAIQLYISEFYTTRLNAAGTYAEVRLAGKILETYFVLNGKRIGVDEPVLKQHFLGKEWLINKLVESRLIRPEPTSRGVAYELSHDKLVEPVEQAKKVRQRRKEQLQAVGVLFFLAVAIVFSVYFYKMKNRYESYYANSVNLTAKQQYDLGRHHVAYRMWTDEENKDSIDNLTNKLLFAPFAGHQFAFDKQQRYVAVQYKDDSIAVFERTKDSTYLRIALPVLTQKPISFTVAGSTLAIVDEKDTVQRLHVIHLPTRKLLSSDNSMGPYRPTSAILSPTGKYMLLTDKTDVPHLFKLMPVGSKEDCAFNISGQKIRSDLSFLPNDSGCSFVFDPRMDQKFRLYVSNFKWDTTFNIIGHRNSASGQKILLWTKEGNLRTPFVFDVATKAIDKLAPVPFYFHQAAFINNDSLLVVVHGVFKPNYQRASDLSVVSLIANKRSTGLKPFVQLTKGNLNKYFQNLKWFIIESPGDSSYLFLRNIKNPNSVRKLPFKKYDYELLGMDYLVFETISNGKVSLFSLSTAEQLQLGTFLSENAPEYELYTSPDKKTVKLILRAADTLSIRTIVENGINYMHRGVLPTEQIAGKGRGFTSMELLSGMLQVQLSDESYILLFLDNRKNKFPYLAEKIYPALTPKEREQYLGKK